MMSATASTSQAAQTATQTNHDRENLLTFYHRVRKDTEDLCRPLATEDYCIQTAPFVSPAKWHIAHISWFFEAFLLKPHLPGYREFNQRFDYLFNSYYETHGTPYPRPERGLLSRPTVEEIYQYRAHVDGAMSELIDAIDDELWGAFSARVVLGLHHEQQHQELLLTDIKHVFAHNPLRPAYCNTKPSLDCTPVVLEWFEYDGGVKRIGHEDQAFCFDNETPRHRVLVNNHALASRLVTNGEFLAFMESGGYKKPDYWLSDGWSTVCREQWTAPLYWEEDDGTWSHMTMAGMRAVRMDEPVCHVSFYEADAYARWAGKRLPTEPELELAAAGRRIEGNFRESAHLHPRPALADNNTPRQVFGDVWEWTQSPYGPYPGFRPLEGTLGEYNGKFMCSQLVLRGGSCVTPVSHIRATYRNFFYPGDRWQFTGIRLADDR